MLDPKPYLDQARDRPVVGGALQRQDVGRPGAVQVFHGALQLRQIGRCRPPCRPAPHRLRRLALVTCFLPGLTGVCLMSHTSLFGRYLADQQLPQRFVQILDHPRFSPAA